jgi:serine protease Do
MNEFDNNEERLEPHITEENEKEAVNNTSDSTEGNTTYHYAYKKPENKEADNNTPQGGYYQPPQSTEYCTAFNGEPINSTPFDASDYGAAPKKKKNKTVIVLVTIFVACILFAVIGIITASISSPDENKNFNSNPNSSSQVQTQDQEDVPKTTATGEYTVAGVAENCIDSCVGITVYTQSTSYSNFYGYGYGSGNQQGNGSEEVKSGEGSGILMLEDNGRTYILTCAHVISDGSSFKVTLNDKTEYDATMVGYDAQTDIGVLVINATGLKIAEFAKSDSTVLGEQVVAIGCPGGIDFLNSISSGYISALARPISSTIGYDTDCIQIDAAINPGNSGGALFNMQGQVVGVNSSKIAATEYEGMGFAVPSDTAIETANSLIRVGYVEGRAKLGITYKNITSYSNSTAIINELARLGYENANGTMVINEVSSDSDLAGKDINEYDMIIAVNGETMTSTDVMTSILADSKPGDSVKLTIARIQNNQINTFEVECKLIESKG